MTIVNLATNTGTVNYNLSAFHLGIGPINPPDSVITPLKVRYCQASELSYDRVIGFGGILENQYETAYEGAHGGSYPGDGGSYAAWEDWVENHVLRPKFVTPGKTASLQMEVWNEPDNDFFWPFSRPVSQFFETYRRAVVRHRSIAPSVPIVGPGSAYSDQQIGGGSFSVREFLIYARDNNVLPDILDWHEVLTANPYLGSEFITRVADMRTWLDANLSGTDATRLKANIQIGEWGYPGQHLVPGSIIVCLANMQRAGIVRAGAACWDDTGAAGNNQG